MPNRVVPLNMPICSGQDANSAHIALHMMSWHVSSGHPLVSVQKVLGEGSLSDCVSGSHPLVLYAGIGCVPEAVMVGIDSDESSCL